MTDEHATIMADFAAAVAAFNRASKAAAQNEINAVGTLYEARPNEYGIVFPQLTIIKLEQAFE